MAERPINTIKIAQTDTQIEQQFAEDGISLDIIYDAEERARFKTTQPEARVNRDLEVGDRVIIHAMSSHGVLGEGSIFIGEIYDIEYDRGLAWIEGR